MFILYFGQTTPFSQFFRRLRLTAPLKRQSLHIGQFLQDLYPYLCLTGKEEREAGVVAAGSGSEWSSLIHLWYSLCVCVSLLLSLSVSFCLFICEKGGKGEARVQATEYNVQ